MTGITIYLRKTTGKGSRLEIDSQMLVTDLIIQTHKILNLGIHSDQCRVKIFYRGVCINQKTKQNVSQIGIEANSILHIVEHEPNEDSHSEQLKFKFILSNQLLQYSIKKDRNIHQLKAMICADLRITEEDLTLIYLGAQLDNSLNIRDYQLTSNVLLSGLVTNTFNQVPHKHTYSIEPSSIQQQSIDKMSSENVFNEHQIKRTESQRDQSVNNKEQMNFKVYSSARINPIQKIKQRNTEQKLITESSDDISQAISETEEQDKQWSMPNMNFNYLFTKPMFQNQGIIQTQSLVGDEEEDSVYAECLIDVTRIDKKRQYLIECSSEDTFEDAQALVARLEHVQRHNIKFLITFDEVSRSGISSRSGKIRIKKPNSSQEFINPRTSAELKVLSSSQMRMENMKMKIVEKAARLKTKTISFEFEVYKQS